MDNCRRKNFCANFNISSPRMLATFVKPASASPKFPKRNKAVFLCALSKNNPAISVIIPMYNAEKYVGECLDSLLAQTFRDFEVIIVDDCSTDLSCKIVKSYIPKFNNRLRLYSTEKNSSSGAIARNIGLQYAKGEYIYNMDNDDMLTKTALEEMYKLAKEYDADVVYCEKYFMSTGSGEEFLKNIHRADSRMQKPPFVNEPTFEIEDLSERIKNIFNGRFWVAPWLKLIRHDLLKKHKIVFPNLTISDDDIWTYGLIFCAKKFLRVPNMVYIRRMRDDSLSLTKRKTTQLINFWLNPVLLGLKNLDNLMSENEFFKQNPQQRYAMLENFLNARLNIAFSDVEQFSPVDVYEVIKEIFGKNLKEYDILISALCTYVCKQTKNLKENSSIVKRDVAQEIPKRIVKSEYPTSKRLPVNEVIPSISVIIPMYNAEKYIGECLESLFVQTFQDFEAIVIDDCSTDNSVSVVENYIPKFNGRLKLTKTEKNTGNGNEPRNVGFRLAMGEYVFFIDADDALTKTALEEMFKLAKEYDADVVHCERYYVSEGSGQEFKDNIRIADIKNQKLPFINKPTLETENMTERTEKAVTNKIWMTQCLFLVQRQLMIDNDIIFDSLVDSKNISWSFKVFFYSKRFLRIPNICYIRRTHNDSSSFREHTPAEWIQKWMDLPVRGMKNMDNFLDEIDFFRNNLDCRYEILNYFLQSGLSNSFKECQNLTDDAVYDIFRKIFGEYLGEYDVLTATLYSYAFKQCKGSLENRENALTASSQQVYEHFLKIRDFSMNIYPSTSFVAQKVAFPAISVIVPMYNVEKYVGECLDSLLAQTFKRFEIIVVDDCSTDNSYAIVENYMSKFEGRLSLVQMEENSGYAGFPRNKGIELAHGEYLFFIDPDDTITTTALEELYSEAKKFNADVVHCEKYYLVPDEFYNDIEYRNTLMPYSWPNTKKTLITQPTLLTNDFEKRVRDFSQGWLQWASWMQLIRRDFLVDNGIRFLNIYSQDMIFTMCELCCAKNYLVVPNIIYYWRQRGDSKTQEKMDTAQIIQRYVSVLKNGTSYLDEFLNRQEFFTKRTDLKYCLFDTLFITIFGRLNRIYRDIPVHEFVEFVRKEFDGDNAFTAFIFNTMNLYRLRLQPPLKSITKPTVDVIQLNNEVSAFTPKEFPAVSIIIPMYNVEKYVGECLDSLLAQTFQNFEIIVVDDCSTDNSRAVVESYMSRFNDRLTLIQLEKNSGGAGFPRNKGIELARGEYISFIDPDDTIAPNTFEKFYKAAKNSNADVVQCEKYYDVPNEFYYDSEYRKKLKPYSWPTFEKQFITKPSLLTNDLEKRVKDFSSRWLTWSTVVQFIRREFLINNKIRFSDIYSEDMIFTTCELCCAKNYVLLPNAFYYWRHRKDSQSQETIDISQSIHKFVKALKKGISCLDQFLNRQEFFSQRDDLKQILFNNHAFGILKRLNEIYGETPIYKLDEFLRQEFDNDSAFVAFLFNALNVYRLKLNPSPNRIIVPETEINRVGGREYDFLSGKMPAISVIVPMYNVEKYIGECLNSLLIQTFQDFEVIVVDDCSTDNSCEVVESYKAKFNGRLKLHRIEKNTGSPGEPSNIGVDLSRGEYLFIIDNDDVIIFDAFEKLYNIAKMYDADVVTCEKFYRVPEKAWYDEQFYKTLKPQSYKNGDFVTKPTLLPFDVEKRVTDCYDRKFLWPLWTKLINREFLMANKIRFTNNIIQDMLATCLLVYTAKKFVRVPYVINFWRMRDKSLSNQKRDPLKKFQKYLQALTVGIEYLDSFLSDRDSFQKNPELRHIALDTYFREIMKFYIQPIYDEIPVQEREDILREEFANCHNTTLMNFLFDGMTSARKEEPIVNKKFLPYFTARLDAQIFPKTGQGDLQILSVSDKKASINKAGWLPKERPGYFVQSYTGNMEIVAKATTDGQIKLDLRGLDIRDPKDKSKRIPYWIDYTKFIVNGRVIFDKRISAWHDKTYNYTLAVNANDEIKIQIEWLPHQADILPSARKEEPIVNKKFLPYFTARLDAQIFPKTGQGDLQILSVSDKKASIKKAGWLPKERPGYFVQSYTGNMEIVAKATTDGQIKLDLRGLDIRDPKDKSKRIPYWIDYTKFIVNGRVIFDKRISAWHDKPYNYTLAVKANDEIKIQIEWLPHMDNTTKPTMVTSPKISAPKPVAPQHELETARIDIKAMSQEGDFKILSVSDDKANVLKPKWFQKNGIGYKVESYTGKLEIVAKSAVDDQIKLNLRGLDVRDPEDKSKHVPQWIDYTKLIVNGETILDKITPACWDKFYRHNIEVKADEEIKIEIEWQPHDETFTEQESSTPTETTSETVTPTPTETTSEPVTPSHELETARIDIKAMSQEGNFKILSISDAKANVLKPKWLQKNGIGYKVESYTGKLKIIAKSAVDDQIKLDLRGLDVRDPEDESKHVPQWIDYTKLIVNGETILDKITPACWDKFYHHNIEVKADEEIKIEIEWQPHRNVT